MDNINQVLALRIIRLREKLGLTQRDLEVQTGIDQGQISRIESGKSKLISPHLPTLARFFGISLENFVSPAEPSVEPVPMGRRRIAVVVDMPSSEGTLELKQESQYVLTEKQYSDDVFALEIRGTEMAPDYQEGDVVIIDPKVNPLPGNHVAARDAENRLVFRKYRPRGLNDKGESYFLLEPINPDCEPLRSDFQKITVLGPMVEHRTYR